MNSNNSKKLFWLMVAVYVTLGIFIVFNFSLAQDSFGLENAGGIGLGQTDLKVIIVRIIQIILGFLGIIAVIIILYAGYLWLAAGGDPAKAEKAKKILIAAIIGLIIILSAFTIVSFIFSRLGEVTGGAGPCEPVGATASCGASGCGVRTCEASGYWGSCNTNTPACQFEFSDQLSCLNRFSSQELDWQRNLGCFYTGTVNTPQQADVAVGAYARNRGGSIDDVELQQSAGFENPIFTFYNQFNPYNTPNEELETTINWDTAGYELQSPWRLLSEVTPGGVGSAFSSNPIKAKIRSLNCFNDVQDSGAPYSETGVDCGGDEASQYYCGACEGESCDEDSDCASGLCLDGFCAAEPIIDYISPATDPNGDTDFDDPETWDDDLPNGASGNYITVEGRNFGDNPGQVLFGNTLANLDLVAGCEDTWSNNRIIAEVPSVGLANYNVVVITAQALGSNAKNFTVNNIERPGICNLEPKRGIYPDTTIIYGNKLPTSEPRSIIWYFKPTNVTSTYPTINNTWQPQNNQVIDQVPENRRGRTSVRIYNGVEYSNYFKFLATRGQLDDPCGYDTLSCANDLDTCQPGLVCDGNSCTCQLAPNICADNILGPIEDCDIVNKEVQFKDDKKQCSDYDLGDGQLACDNNCHLDTSSCSGAGPAGEPATQSIYTWAFTVGYDDNWGVPQVVEDCSRVRDCHEGQKLPSPTPWSEDWNRTNYPNLDIENEKACVDAVISARFNTKMRADTLNSNNIKFFECNDRAGNGCAEKGGSIIVKSDNNNLDNDYFVLTPSTELTANKWHKVILTSDIKSDVNINLPIDTSMVDDRACNVNNISGVAYCWNFQTRPDLNLGLSAYYKLAGNANDSSGNRHNGAVSGVQFVTGVADQAASFDGADDYVSLGDNLDMGTASFSVSFWLKNFNSQPNQFVLAKGDAYVISGWDIRFGGNNNLVLRIKEPGSGAERSDIGRVILPANNSDWLHLAYTIDRANNKIISYLDGIKQNEDAIDRVSGSIDNDVPLMIGCLDYDNRGGCDGGTYGSFKIDELRIYGRALTENEVKELVDRPVPSSLKCPEGCVECSPDPRWRYYYGATTPYSANLDSADNVCLMLNPNTRSWGWSSDKTDKERLPGGINESEITGTAIGETIFDRPNPFAKIIASLTLGDKSDYCRAYNDFTNPVVIEDSSCDRGTTQSPTPWMLSTDACRNALISARFSRDMVNSTIKADNIKVEKCSGFNETTRQCDGGWSDAGIVTATNIRVFQYSHDIDYQDLMEGQTDFTEEDQRLAEGFVVDTTSNLAANTWYRVVILGGGNGVRGADTSDNPLGILLTQNSINDNVRNGWDYNRDGQDDYYWTFKTSGQICDVTTVNVLPAYKFMRHTDESQEYNAFPQSANCNILNLGCLLNWTWKSLIDLDDTTDSGNIIATITNNRQQPEICDGQNDDRIDPVQNASAVAEGETNIKAIEPGAKWSSGKLQIGFGDLRVVDYQPRESTSCVNNDISIKFNTDARNDSITLNSNASLYQCNEGVSYYGFEDDVKDYAPITTNDGVITGRLNFTSGKVGQAINFRGRAGEYVEIADNNGDLPANLKITDNLTVTAWVKPTGGMTQLGRLAATTYYWNATSSESRGWGLGRDIGCWPAPCSPNDEFYFFVFAADGNFVGAGKTDFFSDYNNKWVQVAGVFKGGKYIKLYLDGVEVASESTDIAQIAYNDSIPLRIGSRADNNIQGMWQGQIDEVRIYNRALTNRQIRELYADNCIRGVNETLQQRGAPADFIRQLAANPTNNFNTSTQYRMVLKGGPVSANGIIAWNGKPLAGLNYNSSAYSANLAGEECEPGLYPWNAPSGVCNANTCRLDGNLCNTQFAECQNTTTPTVVDYCDDNCSNLGNSNQASCGNKQIESGEECDDGNTNSNDGCASNCLWEGANQRWGSLCGNGELEYGEMCDDGNTRNSDGCSSLCLTESARPAGSTPNAPICGNSIVELGEDCDGGNISAGDGCNSTCLRTGSTVCAGGQTQNCCGNNFMETDAADSFSWVFKVNRDAEFCYPLLIYTNPCPNGIWRIEFPQEVSEATVKIYKGFDAAQAGFECEPVDQQTFWQKTIEQIKFVVKRIFGLKATKAADYWCKISEKAYEASEFATMQTGHYQTFLPDLDVSDNNDNEFEVIGYVNERNWRVINYILNYNWTPGAEYRFKVEYQKDGIEQTPAASTVRINNSECVINDIKVNAWPMGEAKDEDYFFCDRDDCGKNSTNPYLQDQDYPPYSQPGNQHLYRAWALSGDYLVRPTAGSGFNWSLPDSAKVPLNLDVALTDYSTTRYAGDQWANLGADSEPTDMSGRATFTLTAYGSNDNFGKDFNINVFLCDNPWPAPPDFPLQDESDNCTTAGSGDCPNTNFKTYYCRDRGQSGIEDDLPVLSNVGIRGRDLARDQATFKEFLFLNPPSDDAVGIRVVKNDVHYSPLAWYQNNFPKEKQGNPQWLTVDNYQAIKEGRTIYVSAADLSDDGTEIYSDIYLVSYNEGAASTTAIIYNQLINNLQFNAGAADIGGLPTIDVCSERQNNVNYTCYIDTDCQKENLGYCQSDKAKLTRDTKRLADIADINSLLLEYKNKNGGYPALTAGTYISGRTFSVWPSWQATLGNALASALPTDPINKFIGCASPSDPNTCWNETAKSMACPSDAYVYTYYASVAAIAPSEQTQGVYAHREFPATYGYWSPGARHIFSDFNRGDICGLTPGVLTCGDNTCDSPAENCSNCSQDCGQCVGIDSDSDGMLNDNDNCPYISNPDQADADNDKVGDVCDNCSVIKNGADTSVVTCDPDQDGELTNEEKSKCWQKDTDGDGEGDACDPCPNLPDQTNCNPCGNGEIETITAPPEQCDDDNSNNNDGCSSTCQIENGWYCDGEPSVCATQCGDGICVGDENSTNCPTDCPIGAVAACGDATLNIDKGEVCDCGTGTGALAVPIPQNCGTDEPAEYYTYNNQNPIIFAGWTSNPRAVNYCTNNCRNAFVLGMFCGDGEWQTNNEACDFMASPTNPAESGYGGGVSVTDQWSCNTNCQDSGGYCRNNALDLPHEGCDIDVNNNPLGYGGGRSLTNQYGCFNNNNNRHCQDYGGWCGDGIYQSLRGEFCDGEGCKNDCSDWTCPSLTGYFQNDLSDFSLSDASQAEIVNKTVTFYSKETGNVSMAGFPFCQTTGKLLADIELGGVFPTIVTFNVLVNTKETRFELDFALNGSPIFQNQEIDLPNNFCAQQDLNGERLNDVYILKVQGLSDLLFYDTTLKFSNFRLKYCPDLPKGDTNIRGDQTVTAPINRGWGVEPKFFADHSVVVYSDQDDTDLKFQVNIPQKGDYVLKLWTSNYPAGATDKHKIKIYLDGILFGEVQPSADTTESQESELPLNNLSTGQHLIRFDWYNDNNGESPDRNLRFYRLRIDYKNDNVTFAAAQQNNGQVAGAAEGVGLFTKIEMGLANFFGGILALFRR